jgi:hypothetical protein
MLKTMDFKAPLDLIEEERPTPKVLPTGVAPLVGTWTNCDPATRGLVRAVIAAAKQGVTVHLFGACTPTPCDWGVVPGHTYAPDVSSKTAMSFSATYKFDFKETFVTGTLDAGLLTIELFNHFTDGSGRTDYYMKGYFHR